MLFGILFGIIFIVSLIFFLLDFVSPDKEGSSETLYNTGIIITSAVVFLIVFVLTNFLADYGYLGKSLASVLLSEALFMLLIRKVLSILIYRITLYVMSINNEIAVRLEPKFIVKNYDPTSSKNVGRSKGVLRIYHTCVYLICIVITAFCSAFPSLTTFRVNFTVKVLDGLKNSMIGNTGERVAFFFWLILSLLLLIVIVRFVYLLYANRVLLLSNKVDEMRDLTYQPVIIFAIFIVSKIFTYFLVGMPIIMALQDLLFWSIIVFIAIILFFIYRIILLKRAATT